MARRRSNTRMAGERFAGLEEALKPIELQQDQKGSPYFIRMNEKDWDGLNKSLIPDIRGGWKTPRDLEYLLKVSPDEAQRFYDYSRQRKFVNGRTIREFKHQNTRHFDKGVPHAWSSENVYNELLKANGFKSRLNNDVDDLATDLIAEIQGHDYLVDVQNRSNRQQNMVALGVLHNLHNRNYGIGLDAWKQARNSESLSDIFTDVRANIDGGMSSKNIDKLAADHDMAKRGHAKDMLIGGRYHQGDIRNVMNKPAKGSYDFVKPQSVDLIDLNRLRDEMFGMSKGDLIQGGVKPIFQAQDKLKFNIPMEFVEALGALKNGDIDPALIELVQR